MPTVSVVSDLRILGGSPCLAVDGKVTRLPAEALWYCYKAGDKTYEIAEWYEVSLCAVEAALIFYEMFEEAVPGFYELIKEDEESDG